MCWLARPTQGWTSMGTQTLQSQVQEPANAHSPPWQMVRLQQLHWFQGHGAEEVGKVRAKGARHRPMPDAHHAGDGCRVQGLTPAMEMVGSRTALSQWTGETMTGDWPLPAWGGRGGCSEGLSPGPVTSAQRSTVRWSPAAPLLPWQEGKDIPLSSQGARHHLGAPMHRVDAVWEMDGCSCYCSNGDELLLGWLHSTAELKPPDIGEEVDGAGTKLRTLKSRNGEAMNEQSFTASHKTKTGGEQ